MGLRINTNVQSLRAQKELGKARSSLDHAQNKLASGSRIVRSRDDAAGLAISENLRATIRSTDRNIFNAQDGLALLDTAEGALNEISNIVIRMKELSIQAASDTNGNKERAYLDSEYQALKAELQRISDTTEYNGRKLISGEGANLNIQVGPNNNDLLDRIAISTNQQITLDSLGLGDLAVSTSEGAKESLDPITTALDKIAAVRGSLGADGSRLSTTISNLREFSINLSSGFSRIRDADIAFETAEQTKQNILTQAGIAVLAQANSSPSLALKLLG